MFIFLYYTMFKNPLLPHSDLLEVSTVMSATAPALMAISSFCSPLAPPSLPCTPSVFALMGFRSCTYMVSATLGIS